MEDELERFDSCEVYEEMYTVEKILDKKMYKGVWKYKVKWLGWSMKDCTWEPIENLSSCLDLVEDFEKKFEKKGKKQKIVKEEEVEDTNTNNSSNVKPTVTSDATSVSSELCVLDSPTTEENKPVIQEYEGNLDEHIPIRIEAARILNDCPIELNCLVSWERIDDNFNLKATWISSNLIRRKNPELLLKYYESKVQLPKHPGRTDSKLEEY